MQIKFQAIRSRLVDLRDRLAKQFHNQPVRLIEASTQKLALRSFEPYGKGEFISARPPSIAKQSHGRRQINARRGVRRRCLGPSSGSKIELGDLLLLIPIADVSNANVELVDNIKNVLGDFDRGHP